MANPAIIYGGDGWWYLKDLAAAHMIMGGVFTKNYIAKVSKDRLIGQATVQMPTELEGKSDQNLKFIKEGRFDQLEPGEYMEPSVYRYLIRLSDIAERDLSLRAKKDA